MVKTIEVCFYSYHESIILLISPFNLNQNPKIKYKDKSEYHINIYKNKEYHFKNLYVNYNSSNSLENENLKETPQKEPFMFIQPNHNKHNQIITNINNNPDKHKSERF